MYFDKDKNGILSKEIDISAICQECNSPISH